MMLHPAAPQAAPALWEGLEAPALAGALTALALGGFLWRYLRWRADWRRHFPAARRIGARIALAVAGLLALAAALLNRPSGDAARPGRLMLVIDTSGSMLAGDITPSRYAAALAEAGDLINQSSESEIGIIELNSAPELALAPTPDRNAARAELARLGALPPGGGSDLDRAVALAAGFLVPGGGRIVLMTDGERDRGANPGLGRRLRESGIRLQIVGVGTTAGVALPGKPGPAQLHETDLQELAVASGGDYHRLGANPAAPVTPARPPLPLPFSADQLCAAALALLAAAGFRGTPW